MMARFLLLSAFALLLLSGCVDRHAASLVPADDRIPNSILPDAIEKCVANRSVSQSPLEVRQAMCSCVIREMQRTMSMAELGALSKSAAGTSEDAKEHKYMESAKFRQIVHTCIDEAYLKPQP
jgi:hypothetical protein